MKGGPPADAERVGHGDYCKGIESDKEDESRQGSEEAPLFFRSVPLRSSSPLWPLLFLEIGDEGQTKNKNPK